MRYRQTFKCNRRKQRQWAQHGGTSRCIALAIAILVSMIEVAISGIAGTLLLPTRVYARTLAMQSTFGFAAPNVPIVCASRGEWFGDILLTAVNQTYQQPNG